MLSYSKSKDYHEELLTFRSIKFHNFYLINYLFTDHNVRLVGQRKDNFDSQVVLNVCSR